MNLRAGAAPVDDRPDRGHPLGARADGTWRSSSRWPPSARRACASSSSCRPLRERSRFARHDPEPSGLRSARLSESSVDPTSVGGFLVSGSPAPAAPWLPAPAASAPSRRPWLPWLPCPWLPRSCGSACSHAASDPRSLPSGGASARTPVRTCASTVERHGSSTAARPGVHRQQPGPPGRGPALLALWGCSYRFAGLPRMVERLVHAGSLSSRGPRRPFGRGLRLSTCAFGRLPGFGWSCFPRGACAPPGFGRGSAGCFSPFGARGPRPSTPAFQRCSLRFTVGGGRALCLRAGCRDGRLSQAAVAPAGPLAAASFFDDCDLTELNPRVAERDGSTRAPAARPPASVGCV